MGSSIVTMCRRSWWLMWSIIAARVVVLPEPVVPGHQHHAPGLQRQLLHDGGQLQLLEEGMAVTTWRMAMEMLPRCR